jgi:spore germination protein
MADPEHPSFDIQISVEGNIAESYTNAPLMEDKTITEIETKVSEYIQGLTDAALEKLQRGYKTDILGLGTHLREEHYKKWEKIRGDWDSGENYFSQSQVRIHVNTKLRIVGTVIKS